MIAAAEVTRVARSFVGVPYRHQGRSRLGGVDCWGLLWAVGEELGILPDGLVVPADYGRTVTVDMRARMAEHCVETERAEDGVIALMRWPSAREPAHMGICTTNGNLIHSYSIGAKVVEHGFRGPFLKMCDSLWRLPGVAFSNG